MRPTDPSLRNKYRPPVIIMGMHRSGTTMVVSLLKKLGFFAGAKMGKNLEAFFFQWRNEGLLRRAGGAWDNPLPSRMLSEVSEYRQKAADQLKKDVDSWRVAGFTGYFQRQRLSGPWGWKDPRNIFTASIWLDVFPEAKIIYIKRNGVDVAHSLNVREKRSLADGGHDLLDRGKLYRRLGNAARGVERFRFNSVRCLSIMECFRLWEEYNAEGDKFYNGYEGEKLLCRYEDILLNPIALLMDITSFCGLKCDENDLRELARNLDPGRANAFLNDRRLAEFYDEVRDSELMREAGYDKIKN